VESLLEGYDEVASLVFKDGSGVSHQSFVTPRATETLLEALKVHPDFEVIWDALPIAGVDGTLERRMKGTPAQAWLRAKTGTLSDAYNLAGYIPTESDWMPTNLVSFVHLISTSKENGKEARALIDRTGAELSRVHKP
jgi:D-alanyl-D-alanine carboxypeptidase/D-alanyl-D-alanine-endopeptidase (penicillin-binding protein 4)